MILSIILFQMALNYCCCCINLRVGAIVIAILQILSGFGSFIQIGNDFRMNYELYCDEEKMKINNLVAIVICFPSLVAGICLLFGAINRNALQHF